MPIAYPIRVRLKIFHNFVTHFTFLLVISKSLFFGLVFWFPIPDTSLDTLIYKCLETLRLASCKFLNDIVHPLLLPILNRSI
jgi:hypothetical protein